MNQQRSSTYRLFDHLRAVHGIVSDADLARKLDVAPPVISKMRKGAIPLGASLMLNIHETFSTPIAEIRDLAGKQDVTPAKKECSGIDRVARHLAAAA